ncbi:MAG: glycosyltransferase [Chitinophagales bacterium]|nr:glycosyltransferase [Chitinophagales bacterium]
MKAIIFTVTNDITHDRRMQRICESLSKNGFDVTLIGRELTNSKQLTQFSFKTIRLRCLFNKGKLFYLEYNFRLFWKLLFMCADVYAAVDLDTIIPCFKVAFLKGKKKVFDAHEYFEDVPEVVNRPVTKMIWSWVGKMFVPHADLALTVSESLAEQFHQLYGIRFETIRNVPKKTTAPANTGNYLLYQGALNEGRGLEQLIEAMQSIDMPLKIAGEGDLSDALRQKVNALGLQQKIEFLGFVSPEKLDTLTANAWLGLNLLENKGLSYYYSLANKFFDYINHGVPSLNMGFPEYKKINAQFDVSLLLKDLSAQAIVEAVYSLKENPALYEQLRKNCIEAREELNWEREEQKLLNLYFRFG